MAVLVGLSIIRVRVGVPDPVIVRVRVPDPVTVAEVVELNPRVRVIVAVELPLKDWTRVLV